MISAIHEIGVKIIRTWLSARGAEAEQLIAALVQAFFFMNVSNNQGCIHGNGLVAAKSLKSNVNDVSAQVMCKRCPGIFHLGCIVVAIDPSLGGVRCKQTSRSHSNTSSFTRVAM